MKIYATEAECAAIWENKDASAEEIALCMSYFNQERMASYLKDLATTGVLAEQAGLGAIQWPNVVDSLVLAVRMTVERTLADGTYVSPEDE